MKHDPSEDIMQLTAFSRELVGYIREYMGIRTGRSDNVVMAYIYQLSGGVAPVPEEAKELALSCAGGCGKDDLSKRVDELSRRVDKIDEKIAPLLVHSTVKRGIGG